MNKKCPFCKKNISSDISDCPYCKRILRESIGSPHPVINLPNKSTENIHFEKKNHFKFNKPSFNLNYLGIIPVIILIIALASGKTFNIPGTSNISNIATPFETSLPANYTRLANGTIISSSIHNINDMGTLEIDNGTSDDAIAKLTNVNSGLAVITIYIQANSNFTITNIANGKYKLLFHTGKDWSEEKKKFLFNPSFSKFTDDFIYTTTNTKYTTYQVTLNPVLGGTATTDPVTESEFEKY